MNVEYGDFQGGIPFAKVGRGGKNLIYLVGGPGNDVPRGMMLNMYIAGIRHLTDDYTVWVTTRKKGQQDGYGTREMASDTAEALRKTFGDRVDVVVGFSFGGMIALWIAADHPGLSNRYVLISTALRVPEYVADLDMLFAEHLAAGRNSKAMGVLAEYLEPPGVKKILTKMLFQILGGLGGEKHHPEFAFDVIQEANAEALHDASEGLRLIVDPVLVMGGDSDLAIPWNLMEETAAGIPGSKLIIYKGKGHSDVHKDKHFRDDLLAFLTED